jgi:hypothetical protein
MNQATDSKGQMRVTQQQVLDFARWTGDCNPIHVDPVAAKESAFGGTICHGMLVLIEALPLGISRIDSKVGCPVPRRGASRKVVLEPIRIQCNWPSRQVVAGPFRSDGSGGRLERMQRVRFF